MCGGAQEPRFRPQKVSGDPGLAQLASHLPQSTCLLEAAGAACGPLASFVAEWLLPPWASVSPAVTAEVPSLTAETPCLQALVSASGALPRGQIQVQHLTVSPRRHTPRLWRPENRPEGAGSLGGLALGS